MISNIDSSLARVYDINHRKIPSPGTRIQKKGKKEISSSPQAKFLFSRYLYMHNLQIVKGFLGLHAAESQSTFKCQKFSFYLSEFAR